MGIVAYQRHRISPETVVWKLQERLFDAPAKVTNQIYQQILIDILLLQMPCLLNKSRALVHWKSSLPVEKGGRGGI